MSKIVQEKFQINYPYQKNDDARNVTSGENWVTDAEARAKKNMPGREGLPGGDSNSRFGTVSAMFHSLPQGMDIEDQEYCDIRKMEVRDVINYDQVTKDATTRSLVTGFDRKKLLNTDDEYTREHNDPFYSDMVVEDEIGFVERNNMLDRL